MAFSMPRFSFGSQRGQILLVVVLVMVTTLTVGLSLLSRNVTNLKTSTEEANSQKALSAAEAGVERAIQTGGSIASFPQATIGPNVSYQTSVTQLTSSEFTLKNGASVDEDDSADVWLSDYPNFTNPWNGSNPNIFWGNMSDSCGNGSAALEVVVLTTPSGDTTSPAVERFAFDPCTRNPSNNFDTASVLSSDPGGYSCNGKTYKYRTQNNSVSIPSNTGLFMRILPIYASSPICVTGSSSLPNQGFLIDSVGFAGSTERRVKVFQGYPRPPIELFPYGLFQP